jgi:DNA polymerase-3 subunit alpha
LKLPGRGGSSVNGTALVSFNKPFGEAHNATADVEATAFLGLIRAKFLPGELDVPASYLKIFKIEPN